MDRVSIVKRQFRMEEWRKRIAECQASGIPVSHWCKQNGYCEQTYYKYLKRIREEMVDALISMARATGVVCRMKPISV